MFYIFPIFTFSLLYNLPKFLELSVTEVTCITNSSVPNNETECLELEEDSELKPSIDDGHEYHTQLKIEATSLRLNPFYVKYYLIYLNFIIHAIIPLILLLIFVIISI